jgi:hypothetical protein
VLAVCLVAAMTAVVLNLKAPADLTERRTAAS